LIQQQCEIGFYAVLHHRSTDMTAHQFESSDEAARIMLDTGSRRAIGIHRGTFQLTDEGRDEPAIGLEAALAANGIDPALFVAGVPGGVYDLA